MILTILLVVQALVAAVLVGVILMQQSEGGGLGMGGSPTGLMSARGAADFMTRATTILAAVFIGLSILHAVLAARTTGASTIDTSLARKGAPTQPLAAPVAPKIDPLAVPTPGAPVTPPPALGVTPTPIPTPVPSAQSKPIVRIERVPATPKPRAEPKREVTATPVAPPPVVASPVVTTPAPTPAPANGN